MKDQVTSIEQSKQLIGMGVPADKASMVYRKRYIKNDYVLDMESREMKVIAPAFTVADLLGLLPPKISCQDPSDGNFRMRRYMGENGIE